MSRTNIDIDDELIAAVIKDYNLHSKREAVDLALRLARRPQPLTVTEVLAMRGTNFIDPDFDIDAFRAPRVFAEPDTTQRPA